MKVLKITLVFIVLLFILENNVFASNIIRTGKEWLQIGKEEAGKGIVFANNYDSLGDLAGLLMGFGIFAVVGAGMVIGAKYMISSPDKKAELKKVLIGYTIGSILILGALGIWKLSINILQSAL